MEPVVSRARSPTGLSPAPTSLTSPGDSAYDGSWADRPGGNDEVMVRPILVRGLKGCTGRGESPWSRRLRDADTPTYQGNDRGTSPAIPEEV